MCRMIGVAVCLTLLSSVWTAHGFYLYSPAGVMEGECGDGMTIIGQFFNCTKPEMEPYRVDQQWVQPGYTLNRGILNYLRTYCGMILPRAVQCLKPKLSACDQDTRQFVINDVSGAGGFCDGRNVATDITNLLNALPAVSPSSVEKCPEVDSSQCYSLIHRHLYTKDVFYLQATDLAPHVDRTFDGVFRCLVTKYRAHRAQCPNWQLNLLWHHTLTFLPTPLGYSLSPVIVQALMP